MFAATALGGTGYSLQPDMVSQLAVQALGILVTAAWCAALSWLLLRLIDATVGLRVSEEDESEGLDLAAHGERSYSP